PRRLASAAVFGPKMRGPPHRPTAGLQPPAGGVRGAAGLRRAQLRRGRPTSRGRRLCEHGGLLFHEAGGARQTGDLHAEGAESREQGGVGLLRDCAAAHGQR
ncbi:unnamed protein product, partial [Effrenium voratum]